MNEKYKLGDIIVWTGSDPAIIRILTVSPHNNADWIDAVGDPTEKYSSMHLSMVRKATPIEIIALGHDDVLPYEPETSGYYYRRYAKDPDKR